jgi:alanyl-tRNA synthetase
MKSEEIRSCFLKFFKKRGHVIIPSAPLVPENDPTVLFNTAGMQPLVPYLLGTPHPAGKRIADVQKCVRTTDIDDVGDNTHATFFEMLGNWSLGDYFKEDAIKWSYELLTSKEGFGLDPKRLYVTVFEGDENSPKDMESFEMWKKAGLPETRIYFKGADSNWWPAVKGKDTWTGPTGPCTEMFYDVTEEGLGDLTKEEYIKADEEQKVVEIWNDVFMQFEKKDGKIVGKLKTQNVDTGAGLERVTTMIQGKKSIFDTDLFAGIMEVTKTLTSEVRSQRILADHIRSSVFLIGDGVRPSNTDQGYILRRILRRAIFNTQNKNFNRDQINRLVDAVVTTFSGFYSEIEKNREVIKQVIEEESGKFEKVLHDGIKIFHDFNLKKQEKPLTAKIAFHLFSSRGLPIDVTLDLAKKENILIDQNLQKDFEDLMEEHQKLSRSGSEQKFKGGLADTSDKSLQYHTATHLLHKALREVLGEHVQQKGSNITPERLRFDFAHTAKMTDEEKKKVEDIVNQKIQEALPVQNVILPKAEAEKSGALHFFAEKYGDEVSIYFVGKDLQSAFSKEFCGGPHVKNTNELKGQFKIQKEEAVSAGVRRIKAVIE